VGIAAVIVHAINVSTVFSQARAFASVVVGPLPVDLAAIPKLPSAQTL